VLAIAAAQGRILVTHDFRTIPKDFAEFLSAGNSSPGVFLVKQRTPFAQVIDELVLVGRRQSQETGRIGWSRSHFVESPHQAGHEQARDLERTIPVAELSQNPIDLTCFGFASERKQMPRIEKTLGNRRVQKSC
jgi:hypothetical protein